ncbi:L-galactose dehydrogenase-like [Pollicipes pollicipes]|uniref:L-galactose dehydrogenase-like n=1 Tax=Pollicipes pollicipes TaxID=41117 RepID=UPI0018854F0E|nr:L-galactose dehydrogenase-like [Pollicipes pollicipes]XP_037075558.1 L-galactose dehydrogenase-like [Pollicipes pollicipes]XP_037075559.1 L-galactose dehydrogenase-like [Pollicipes pollicipes]XP_037075560.1 L-galactose dehydrogenase-like [Pollicipes pollicipes]XP_037075561.1 L-galactose dehydrogenase-like [Pollicipes pollicipes]XP_037075562.1 L-galactose dehydrogenase-like [Pollicipes pollicipes]
MEPGDLPPTYVEGFHDLDAVKRMKYTRLGNTDLMVSKLGYGASGLGLCYEAYDWEAARAALLLALRSGVNYIDTAPWYGQGRSERTLGQMLKGVPRKAYYIATKVGRYDKDYEHMFDFSGQRVLKSVENSLQLLGLPSVDVLQVHDLEFCPRRATILNETLPALHEVRARGLTRYLGITGYHLGALLDVLDRSTVRVDTVLSYSRNNLHDTALQRVLPRLQAAGVGVIDAAATCMGLFCPQGPPDWHTGTPEVLRTAERARQLCQERGVNIARLAVNFVLTEPGGATCLTSMMTPEIVRENLAQVDRRLTDLERRCSDEIRARFAALNPDVCHWEGIAEKEYWDALGLTKDDDRV